MLNIYHVLQILKIYLLVLINIIYIQSIGLYSIAINELYAILDPLDKGECNGFNVTLWFLFCDGAIFNYI